jgi:hypothetical protein
LRSKNLSCKPTGLFGAPKIPFEVKASKSKRVRQSLYTISSLFFKGFGILLLEERSGKMKIVNFFYGKRRNQKGQRLLPKSFSGKLNF